MNALRRFWRWAKPVRKVAAVSLGALLADAAFIAYLAGDGAWTMGDWRKFGVGQLAVLGPALLGWLRPSEAKPRRAR